MLGLHDINLLVQEGAASGGRPDALFGVGWVSVLLTGISWFVVILASFILYRFIFPPKGRTVIGKDGVSRQDKE